VATTVAGDADRAHPLRPLGHRCGARRRPDAAWSRARTEIGWLAQGGRIPRGYLGDEAKTQGHVPRVDGVRWSVPGDRAALRADGTVELHGRESVTINTGGEKVFAEEVEQVLKHHPGVYDALVVGRPSPTWGQEVVAVVALAPGATINPRGAAGRRRRAPRPLQAAQGSVLVEQISRSPSGKPDYAWARARPDAHR
jgi:3-oxocholest-4-en-26-oate---CoA ligase